MSYGALGWVSNRKRNPSEKQEARSGFLFVLSLIVLNTVPVAMKSTFCE